LAGPVGADEPRLDIASALHLLFHPVDEEEIAA
jgi:hypothetical protein